ncbi:MAG: MmgE/PrpD family protein [Pseudomonadota bacterium]
MNLNVAETDVQSVESVFVRFARGHLDRAASANAFNILKLSLLDWLAVGAAGVREPVSTVVRDHASGDGGTGDAAVFGLDQRLPARAAALVNGTTSHALDYDDTHFAYLGHPSVAVFPAALALAERSRLGGQAFLEAALVGVETACRIGQWMGRSHYEAGFHQTATSGTFGAVAAGARLLGLTDEQTGHAFGLAATKASGLKSQFGTMGKPYHAGLAASNGVDAAMLAAGGFVSNPIGLSGHQGFAATHGRGDRNPGNSFAGLGRSFLFEQVQHKFHACCHGTHAMLEAIYVLMQSQKISLPDVAAMRVTVHPRFLDVCNIAEPRTGLEAKFSFRQTAAMAFAGVDTGALENFDEHVCHRPELASFRQRVSVETDANLADGETTIEVTTASGDSLSAHHDIDAELPLAEREAKVRSKAASLLGADRAAQTWDRISALESSSAPVSLSELLGRICSRR